MRHTRKYNQTLGFYMPSMFHLHVHTKKSIRRWWKWDDKTRCTFLHEYIHFLQDISTVAGLYNIYVMGECLADRVNRLYKMTTNKVKVPIPLIAGANNVQNNQNVLNAVEGTINLTGADEDTLQITGKATVKSQNLNLNGTMITMYEVHVPYRGGDFLLGNYHISESMAYIGEQIMYGKPSVIVEPSPNYPYDMVRQLAHFYSPTLENNLPLLFCLCDYTMTFSHSGKALIGFFENYVNAGCPSDWRTFMMHLISHTHAAGTNGMQTYADGLRSIKYLAIQSLDLKFNNATYNDIRRWYYNVINRAVEMRLQYPLFIYDFVSSGDLKTNKQFSQLLKGIGTPVMTNDYFKTSFTSKVTGCPLRNRRAQYLIAAGSITYALGDAIIPCDLKEICNAKHKCVGKKCNSAPWKHAKMRHACPYGHLWYGWSLKDKELVR